MSLSKPEPRRRGSKRLDFAKRLGILRQRNRLVQTELALAVARLALDGHVDEEDASEIYLAYWSPDGVEDRGTASVRVQASKLRQIIKLVKRDGPRGVKTLTAVARFHERLPRNSKFSCYDAMVQVARRQLQKSKALSDIEVHQITMSLRTKAAS